MNITTDEHFELSPFKRALKTFWTGSHESKSYKPLWKVGKSPFYFLYRRYMDLWCIQSDSHRHSYPWYANKYYLSENGGLAGKIMVSMGRKRRYQVDKNEIPLKFHTIVLFFSQWRDKVVCIFEYSLQHCIAKCNVKILLGTEPNDHRRIFPSPKKKVLLIWRVINMKKNNTSTLISYFTHHK